MQEDRNSSASATLPVVPESSETIHELRVENAKLREQLESMVALKGDSLNETSWDEEMRNGIVYSDQLSRTSSVSAGRLLKQLTGVSHDLMRQGNIRNSSDFEYLPTPSSDRATLEADFVRWGYCLVEDAMSGAQIEAQLERLLDQAEAELKQGHAIMTGKPASAQLVNNLVLKGEIFRDAVEFKESAAQGGPLVDLLLTKIMGEGFGLGCAHGSIVHRGGGLQEIHIDQGLMPFPYPRFPLGSLIIWCYSDFDLDKGGTYVVPGSHRTASGDTRFTHGVDLLKLIEQEPGLVAISAPRGTCIITDTRVLHGGGQRTASGTRYAMRCHYNRHFIRPLHEQSSANIHVPDHIHELLSDRLKHMMGIRQNDHTPLGEMSLKSYSE